MSVAESTAIAWANAHASEEQDPIIFGAKVAAVFFACALAEGDGLRNPFTVASLAALSARIAGLQSRLQDAEQVSS